MRNNFAETNKQTNIISIHLVDANKIRETKKKKTEIEKTRRRKILTFRKKNLSRKVK